MSHAGPIEQLLGCLTVGIPMNAAAAIIGLPKSTLYSWLKRGRIEPGGPYGQFVQRYEQVVARLEAAHVATVLKAAKTDWRASVWFLERRFPERWRRYQTQSKRLGRKRTT